MRMNHPCTQKHVGKSYKGTAEWNKSVTRENTLSDSILWRVKTGMISLSWISVGGTKEGCEGCSVLRLDLGAGCTGVVTLWPPVKLYAYERYIFLYIHHTLIRSLLKKRNNYREEIHGKYKVYYWNGTLNFSLSPVSQWERPAQKASSLHRFHLLSSTSRL